MKKSLKKLGLSRETITALDPEVLSGAAGMSTVPGCVTSGCNTKYFTCRSNPQLCATQVANGCANTQTGCIGTEAGC
jgi:hypothetical protein